MIVTMKILQCAVKPVSVKRGWRYMRVCNLGHRKVSIVRIMRVNFRKNIWDFRREKRNYLLYTGVCIKWVSAQRGPTVVYSYFEKGCRKKVPATIQKGVVGGFQFTDDFQRNLKNDTRDRGRFVASAEEKQQKSVRQLQFQETVSWLYPILPFGIVTCTFSDNLSRHADLVC